MNETQRAAALRLAATLDSRMSADPEGDEEAAALLRELAAEPGQEPSGWLHEETGDFEHSRKPWMDDDGEWVPLYAAPQQQAEPVQEPVAYIDQRQLAAGYVTLLCITRPEYRSYADVAEGIHYTPVYLHPAQQRKPLTPSMQAEVECDCLVTWNASTYGHSAQDTVHPMFLSAFLSGYRAAERAHGITGEPT